MDAALFAPRVAAGAALTLSSSTADEPVRRPPQTMQVRENLDGAAGESGDHHQAARHVVPSDDVVVWQLRCLQELSEAAVMLAERGAQAEYGAYTALSALVPPEVADAIPPQLRQLAPRPPVQNDLIDVEPTDAPTQPSATLAAANSPETLLANQLGEVVSIKDALGGDTANAAQQCLAGAVLAEAHVLSFTNEPSWCSYIIDMLRLQRRRWPLCETLSPPCGRQQKRWRWQAMRRRSRCCGSTCARRAASWCVAAPAGMAWLTSSGT